MSGEPTVYKERFRHHLNYLCRTTDRIKAFALYETKHTNLWRLQTEHGNFRAAAQNHQFAGTLRLTARDVRALCTNPRSRFVGWRNLRSTVNKS